MGDVAAGTSGASFLGMTHRLARTLLAIATLASLAACREEAEPPAKIDESNAAEDGADMVATETDVQILTSSLVSSAPNGTILLASVDLAGADLGTRAIGDGARAIYIPRGCVTVTHDEASRTAVYEFARCTGPNGLRVVSGRVTARYTVEPNHLRLDLSADDMTINGATVDWAASADIVANGVDRTMTWKAQLSGTTGGGREFSRNNEHTVSWRLGEPCFSLSGWSEGSIRRRGEATPRQVRMDVSSFRRCRRACPDAGGSITVTNLTTQQRVEIRYDGTNRARFIGPDGSEVLVPLPCSA
jgi:hypothetical protein